MLDKPITQSPPELAIQTFNPYAVPNARLTEHQENFEKRLLEAITPTNLELFMINGALINVVLIFIFSDYMIRNEIPRETFQFFPLLQYIALINFIILFSETGRFAIRATRNYYRVLENPNNET